MSTPPASRGWGGGKKAHGRKRHIVADTLRLLPTVMVAATSVPAGRRA